MSMEAPDLQIDDVNEEKLYNTCTYSRRYSIILQVSEEENTPIEVTLVYQRHYSFSSPRGITINPVTFQFDQYLNVHGKKIVMDIIKADLIKENLITDATELIDVDVM
jgi:hypothetical protein